MRVRGRAGDDAYGGFGDGYAEYGTAPLPVRGHWEWAEHEPGPAGWQGGTGGWPRRRRRFRWLRRLLTFVLSLALVGAILFGGLLVLTPSVGNAQDLARSYDQAHNAAYPGPPVPVRFADSITATEDHRFFSEPGIDPFGVARVAVGAATGKPDQGGATLYQQLAKMLYTHGSGGPAGQAEEVTLGIKLNLTYTKAQVLRMYADVAYFGHGYYGLASASCGYFSVPPARLSWPQAAMLAGLVQAPSVYDPLLNYPAARARQSHVLGRLVAVGTLTSAQARAYYAQSLRLVPGGGHCAAG
jgi:membrane peptidoglycan carboxypeptidase